MLWYLPAQGHGAGGASTYWRHKCAPKDALTRHLLSSTPKNAPLGMLSSLGVSVGDPHLWVWGSGVPSVGMESGHPAATSKGALRGIGTAGGKDKEHMCGVTRGVLPAARLPCGFASSQVRQEGVRMGRDGPGLEQRVVPKFGSSSSHPQLPFIKALGSS